ncbi:MAG: DJ-1/PfpI family protein [Bacteroidota bacterium]
MKYLCSLALGLFIIVLVPAGLYAQHEIAAVYVCPPCGDGSCDSQTYDQAGQCPHCGMNLISKRNQLNVAIFLYDGVEILDFSGPGEVFAASRPDKGGFRVYTVAATKDLLVSQGFVHIQPEFSIHDCPKPDIIVLPGGNSGPSVDNDDVIKWVQEVEPDLTAALSVCTGAFILERAGLLVGKKATTFHNAIESLREKATETEVLENTRWVDNGKIITTAGVSAGIDGALHLVARIYGLETAEATTFYMEYDKWNPEEGVVVGEN